MGSNEPGAAGDKDFNKLWGLRQFSFNVSQTGGMEQAQLDTYRHVLEENIDHWWSGLHRRARGTAFSR